MTPQQETQMRTEYDRLARDYDDARTAAKGWEHAARTLGDMYAEHRAMLRELVAAADASYVDIHPFAGPGHSKIVGPFQAAIDNARALLARADEGEGSAEG